METGLSVYADSNDGHRYRAAFANHPFAAGGSRHAYNGILYGGGPRNDTPCVTKVFNVNCAMQTRDWIPDVAASKKAKGFADEFMRRHSSVLGNSLEFVLPLIARMEKVTIGTTLKIGEVVGIEPFLPGSYIKFNSNYGQEKPAHPLMTAFCHWTWCVSGGNHIVCDLQGVVQGGKYFLTDPAIHSTNQQYGGTDLGTNGMKHVLANHQCNTICQQLGLHNPYKGIGIPPGPEATVYTFQVTENNITTFNG